MLAGVPPPPGPAAPGSQQNVTTRSNCTYELKDHP
jgi:hypothetical protein